MSVSQPPFQRFLDAHREDVWRFLVAAVGRDAADDCFQETFLAALRAYPRMRPDNPRAWVLTIAHRKALDHFRARKRRALPVGDDLPDVAAPPDPEPRDDGVWARVHALPPKQRGAVLLRFAGDLSHREVAAAMGTSEEAARRNAFEGLRTLRQEMTR
jgi:RNA polymerase sigma factor (sigma-70 family)